LTAHVLLVSSGSTWGLVDSGFGHHLSERQRRFYSLERATRLEQSLAELGVSPNRLDWIVLSHLHLDHAGGVIGDNGREPAFPNASIWVQALEVNEARDVTNRAHGVYPTEAFERFEAAGLIREVDGSADVTATVSVMLTGGHSRGHQATLVQGDGRAGLLHLGDVLATQAQLPPTWVSALDDFPLDTIRAKREWLPKAAQQGWWVTFSHDVNAAAALLDPDGRVRRLWSTPESPGAARSTPPT
jgi:glyoxylase-like metal-dependent hydrolase (beta-lactamase superfamily II)